MMPKNSEHDQIAGMLASLPEYEPDRQCSEQIRMRCHAALRARRREMETAGVAAETPSWQLVLESAAVAAVCLGYLTEVARHALDLYGF